MRIARKLFILLSTAILGFYLPCPAIAADEGAKTYSESCSPCHTSKVRPLDNKHMTKEQWKEAIDRMIDQGAEVPKKKISELLDYLVRTHGTETPAPDADKK